MANIFYLKRKVFLRKKSILVLDWCMQPTWMRTFLLFYISLTYLFVINPYILAQATLSVGYICIKSMSLQFKRFSLDSCHSTMSQCLVFSDAQKSASLFNYILSSFQIIYNVCLLPLAAKTRLPLHRAGKPSTFSTSLKRVIVIPELLNCSKVGRATHRYINQIVHNTTWATCWIELNE